MLFLLCFLVCFTQQSFKISNQLVGGNSIRGRALGYSQNNQGEFLDEKMGVDQTSHFTDGRVLKKPKLPPVPETRTFTMEVSDKNKKSQSSGDFNFD